MALDPQVQALLTQLEAQGAQPFAELGVPAARDASRLLMHLGGDVEPVGEVSDRVVDGPGGDVPVRIYLAPGVDGPQPVTVFFHGGGWTIGDIEIYDKACRSLVVASGAAVVSVDYRLAPEHRFPAAAEDAYAATVWVAEHAAELGLDAGRMAVAGDSAGGNLAAVVAQSARDAGGPALVHQLLIYPATDAVGHYPSGLENAEGYFLTDVDIRWFGAQYLSSPEDARDPRFSPLLADDLAGLPPATVITAEYDPLRDQGRAYAAALEKAGVEVEDRLEPGMVHGFWSMKGVVDAVAVSYAVAGERLRGAFGAAA